MALAFIVMMESARSAQEDLKAIMQHVKAVNAAKKELGLCELYTKHLDEEAGEFSTAWTP